ncbi:MAG: sensor domain-containing diguanylate cyclase [Actinobacteria bacterium]|nr:sensor domain-containing diguanylate cyclase [Actinomycetota bacterium]
MNNESFFYYLSNPYIKMFLGITFVSVIAFFIGYILKIHEKDKKEIKILRNALEDSKRELSKRYADLEKIHEIVKAIHSTLSVKELSNVVRDILEKVLNLDLYSFMVFDNIRKEFVFQTGRNLSTGTTNKILLEIKEQHPFWLKESKDFVVTKEIKTEDTGGPSYLTCLLFQTHKKMIGALCVTPESLKKITREDEEILIVVAAQVAIAIENAMLFELTKKLSIIDEQTNLFNHRYFQKRLVQELERTKRYNRPLSFIMADIDGFKSYNDKFGHTHGDIVISEVANIIVSNCREIDIVARYGGEEFAIILPETDIDGARIVAEKLHKAVLNHKFLGERERRDQKVSLSFGVASYPKQALSASKLIKTADEALGQAKKEGRNKVFVVN